MMPSLPYRVDPDDPRAPPQDVWDRMTPAERAAVVASLPSEFAVTEAAPPEGDAHFKAKTRAREVLGGFFARTGRKIYLACEMAVYYPGAAMFAPDVFAVVDVELKDRQCWVVADEGRGLDVVLEILVSGRRRKDLVTHVERYARLGIPEYFVFDRGRLRLNGWRLADPTAPPARRIYEPIVPQGGRYTSRVLGLDLSLDGERLRFFYGAAVLPEADDLIARLEGMIDGVEARAAEEARLRAEADTRIAEEVRLRAEAEARIVEADTRVVEAERRLAEALAEIERLKRGRLGG